MRAFGDRPARKTPARTTSEEAAGQAKSSAVPADFSQVPARSAGTPLPAEVRGRLEDQLGEDLGDVRVHTGPEAARSARELGAIAYTAGEDIVLSGPADEHLLTHEAAHVVQQRHASRLVPGVSSPGDPAERAAEAGSAVPGGPVAAIQRQVERTSETTRPQVEAALVDYLQRVQKEQGGQTLRVTDQVKYAILQLFAGDPGKLTAVEAWLSGTGLPGTPAALAHEVARWLPAAVPGRRLDQLRNAPATTDPDKRPKTVGEAAGAGIVDTTLTPLLRRTKLSEGAKKLVLDGAKSAVAEGLVKLVDLAMAQARVTDSERGAIHSLVEGLIKQQPGKGTDRQQEGAGSPYAQVVPPSVVPPLPSAPGETILKGPTVKFDFSPVRPAPQPSPAPAPAPVAVPQFDRLVLTPPEARGTTREGDYTLADDFARTVAALLEDAQRKKQTGVSVPLPSSYGQVKDRTTIFQAMKQIFFAVRDALPHHASAVVQVYLLVDGRQVYTFGLH
ncbi:eCIS core domain-containing protein [Amycolatopsis silviterrae]|uniref:DUF4157 domain-containing protein n=1 Tax=Amycolatopsis silviterrae TaxID=1656914 RepID=A0ABW5HA77_9PSEU